MSLRATSLPRVFDAVAVALFLALLTLPSFDAVTRSVEQRTSSREQRTVVPWPDPPASFAETLTWTRRFDAHFRDAFGTRDLLLTAHQWLAMGVLHRDPSPRIVHGRDGWLFWDPEHAREMHRGARPFTARELDEWVECIEKRRASCEALGARYVFALAPTKETVYPEFFPSECSPVGPTRYDQLVERLARTGSGAFVDLRPVMRAERAFDDGGDRTYSKLGSHWTNRGAAAASRALLTALALPGLTPPPRESWNFALSDKEGESLADLTYVADRFHEPLYAVTPEPPEPGTWSTGSLAGAEYTVLESHRPELPHLVLVHDSFAGWLLQFLAPHFGRIDAVNQAILPLDLVHERRPRVVLELFAENVLDTWGRPPALPGKLTRLSEADFSSCERLVGELDVASQEAITLRGGVRRLAAAKSPEGGTDFEVVSVDGLLVIDELAASQRPERALHVRIKSPRASALWLLWRSRAEMDFNRRNRLEIALEPGENDLYLAIERVPEPDALALRLPMGLYTISAIEVRAR